MVEKQKLHLQRTYHNHVHAHRPMESCICKPIGTRVPFSMVCLNKTTKSRSSILYMPSKISRCPPTSAPRRHHKARSTTSESTSSMIFPSSSPVFTPHISAPQMKEMPILRVRPPNDLPRSSPTIPPAPSNPWFQYSIFNIQFHPSWLGLHSSL